MIYLYTYAIIKPAKATGRGAGKAPAASRSAGGTLTPTMEHPTGRRKRLPFCFIRSNSQHTVRLRDCPSCSTGSGYRSSAKAPLRACSACYAKGGKLRDSSEGQTGKGMLFPGFRRSGAAEPVRLRQSVPVRLCQRFPYRVGTFFRMRRAKG